MITIGNIKAGSVRIYKLNSFKAFTEKENEVWKDKNKKNVDLVNEIRKNTRIRQINSKYLFYTDKRKGK